MPRLGSPLFPHRAGPQLLRRPSPYPAPRVATKTATNRHRCRVRRKRQRLPSCLLIENASARVAPLPPPRGNPVASAFLPRSCFASGYQNSHGSPYVPRPPQTPAASFLSPYRKCLGSGRPFSPTARDPSCFGVPPPTRLRAWLPKQPRIAIGAASAANASGFLLVSLSKMPRLGSHLFPHRAATQLLRRSSHDPASRVGTKTATDRHTCRVRRKRQRLPSCLLIENASARVAPFPPPRGTPAASASLPLPGSARGYQNSHGSP